MGVIIGVIMGVIISIAVSKSLSLGYILVISTQEGSGVHV